MNVCSVCNHRNRKRIDNLIAAGTPLRDIAGRFGTTKSALSRHKRHTKAAIQKAAAQRETTIGESVMARLEELYRKTESILAAAERAGKLDLALRAIAEARGNLSGIFSLATTSAETGSLKGFSDGAVLAECQRRNLKTEVAIQVHYGDHGPRPEHLQVDVVPLSLPAGNA